MSAEKPCSAIGWGRSKGLGPKGSRRATSLPAISQSMALSMMSRTWTASTSDRARGGCTSFLLYGPDTARAAALVLALVDLLYHDQPEPCAITPLSAQYRS